MVYLLFMLMFVYNDEFYTFFRQVPARAISGDLEILYLMPFELLISSQVSEESQRDTRFRIL